MFSKSLHSTPWLKAILTTMVALVWYINGLYCKVLDQVPRHRAIVGRILGVDHAVILTSVIGVLEILMVIWLLSGIRARWCAVFQIIIVMVMNVLEFILAPDLLLFGRANIIWATFFCALVYVNEFGLSTGPRFQQGSTG